jgi:hypothetical protein
MRWKVYPDNIAITSEWTEQEEVRKSVNLICYELATKARAPFPVAGKVKRLDKKTSVQSFLTTCIEISYKPNP